jgi:hypothetical protein
MQTLLASALATVFAELVDGAPTGGGAYVLNSGDAGMLGSIDRLSALDASRSSQGGATIAAHAQHVRYGLSLMNRWAREGGNPFADATWDAAWAISAVDDGEWAAIRQGLRHEAVRWTEALRAPRETDEPGLCGMIASAAHMAYHLGAIRQIDRQARGPREGTF